MATSSIDGGTQVGSCSQLADHCASAAGLDNESMLVALLLDGCHEKAGVRPSLACVLVRMLVVSHLTSGWSCPGRSCDTGSLCICCGLSQERLANTDWTWPCCAESVIP